ncbi:MAG TPA: polysaccharide deacetylase family protein [Roseiarcus sp.]|nr:polysaccharide deacetylase family protein [Roseiarcus sp.]
MNRVVLLTVNVLGTGPEEAAHPGATLFARFAHGRYAYRVGLARLLDYLKRMEIPATFFWPAVEAQRRPALLQRCLEGGHEVASHGYAFEDHSALGDREPEVLAAAHEALTRLAGAPPLGFRAPHGLLSIKTLGLLHALGCRYDSSFIDDDSPYLLDDDGGTGMVELPLNQWLIDASHFGRKLTQARAEAFMREEFDALIEESGYACLVLHPRADIGVARAARLEMMTRLLERAQTFSVTFQRCGDYAAALLEARRTAAAASP